MGAFAFLLTHSPHAHMLNRAQQLIAQHVKNNRSVHAIVATIQKAIEGRYTPKAYEDDDYDKAVLVLRLGGSALLYALQKADGGMCRSNMYLSGFSKIEFHRNGTHAASSFVLAVRCACGCGV